MKKNNNSKTNITYNFNTNEKAEITVDLLVSQEGLTVDEAIKFCEIIRDMDNAENNSERKETRRHISLSRFDDDIKAPKLREESISVEDKFIMDEMLKKLYNAIDKSLTSTQKKRLIMRFYDGMTLKDIAKIEGVTYQKIQRSLEAALKKIKKFFPNGV